jgi:hypothetical protein
MKGPPICPRCGEPIHPPGLMNSSWTCEQHGVVDPYQASPRPGPEALAWVLKATQVPLWLPWPLPIGWLVTGMTYAGDDRQGGRATALACSGPAPLGGVGELVFVAEEPGVGLGSWMSGLAGPDPGSEIVTGPPGARLMAAGWPTPLWEVIGDPDLATDRSAWVGEAGGLWLWLIAWPATADLLVHDNLALVDLRDAGHALDLPYGALSPRLRSPG